MTEHDAEARLRHDRAAAERQLAAMDAELAAVAAATEGSNLDDEHDPEGSTVAFEREQLAAVRQSAQHRLRDLDAALARLRDGRYGRCESCGEPIGDARLDALPAARRCMRCARRPG